MTCSRCGGTGLIKTYRIILGRIEKESTPCDHSIGSMAQPVSDGTHLGNLRVWVWSLEHWPFVGDEMTNPSLVITHLNMEIQACKEMGIDILREIGATPKKLKRLARLVQAEHRQRYTRVMKEYKESASQATAA